MKPKNSDKLRAGLRAVIDVRSNYQRQVSVLLKRFTTVVDRVAHCFTPEELIILSAAYEMLPRHLLRKARIAERGHSDYALQRVIGEWFDFNRLTMKDWRGLVESGTFSPLAHCTKDGFDGVSGRIYSLSADESLGLLIMLEAGRALPHGVRSYPSWWTSRALLGIFKRADCPVPWLNRKRAKPFSFDGKHSLSREIDRLLRAPDAPGRGNDDSREVVP